MELHLLFVGPVCAVLAAALAAVHLGLQRLRAIQGESIAALWPPAGSLHAATDFDPCNGELIVGPRCVYESRSPIDPEFNDYLGSKQAASKSKLDELLAAERARKTQPPASRPSGKPRAQSKSKSNPTVPALAAVLVSVSVAAGVGWYWTGSPARAIVRWEPGEPPSATNTPPAQKTVGAATLTAPDTRADNEIADQSAAVEADSTPPPNENAAPSEADPAAEKSPTATASSEPGSQPPAEPAQPARAWTSVDGIRLEADYAGYSDGQVHLKTRDGQAEQLSVEQLSRSDRQFVFAHVESSHEPDVSHPRDMVRTWHDSTGTYEVKALCLGFDARQVVLLKADGKIIRVPLNRLSNADRAVAAGN